jgi:hypothetical protein
MDVTGWALCRGRLLKLEAAMTPMSSDAVHRNLEGDKLPRVSKESNVMHSRAQFQVVVSVQGSSSQANQVFLKLTTEAAHLIVTQSQSRLLLTVYISFPGPIPGLTPNLTTWLSLYYSITHSLSCFVNIGFHHTTQYLRPPDCEIIPTPQRLCHTTST